MKMHFLFGPFFWGMIFLLIGIGIILRAFHIYIPLVRIFFGLIIILIGIKMLVGHSFWKDHNSAVFGHKKWHVNSQPSGSGEYNIIFGEGEIDLTNPDSLGADNSKEINVVFGSATVLLSDKIPVEFQVSTAFGSANMPGRSLNMIGSETYRMPGASDSTQVLHVTANVVFGELNFRKVPSTGTTF